MNHRDLFYGPPCSIFFKKGREKEVRNYPLLIFFKKRKIDLEWTVRFTGLIYVKTHKIGGLDHDLCSRCGTMEA